MTREEEIKQAAEQYERDLFKMRGINRYDGHDIIQVARSFAEWADEHPKNPWISVKDRLPEEGQQILEAYTLECTVSGSKSIDEEVLFSCYRGKFVCDGKETNYGIGKSKSTTHHWMPIPETPKGGER